MDINEYVAITLGNEVGATKTELAKVQFSCIALRQENDSLKEKIKTLEEDLKKKENLIVSMKDDVKEYTPAREVDVQVL